MVFLILLTSDDSKSSQHSFTESLLVDLKYPDKQLFLSCPVLSIRLFLDEIEQQMNKRLRQHVSDFCSRWRVKMSTRGPFAQLTLCFVQHFFRKEWLDVRHCVCSRPLASGSRSSHLVWKIPDWARAGHLQLQAFSSQTQKHFLKHATGVFGGGRTEEISSRDVSDIFFIIHDCRVMRCTERDEVLLPALDGFQFGRLSVFLALHLKYRSTANKTNRQFFI